MSTRRLYTTQEAARRLFVKPATMRFSHCTKGHYSGVRPQKMPSGRLAWPADEIDRLISGETYVSKQERQSLREMLDSSRGDLEVIRDALGVAVEPHQSLIERMVDAAQAKRGAIPNGWKLTPLIATREMDRAFREGASAGMADQRHRGRPIDTFEVFDVGYRAMLNAAPAPDHFGDAAEMVETIHWITDETLPDAEELVLVEIEGEGVWPGSCDGHHWINADGFPIERELIIAWARMPLGSKDGV